VVCDKQDNNKDSIPLVDLIHQHEEMDDEILRCILKVVKSGKYILHNNVTAFEGEVAEYLNANR